MKTVLVTGGTGFIGANLTKHLTRIGFHVVVVSRAEKNPVEGLANVSFYPDSANSNALKSIFAAHQVDVVIHLATLYKHEIPAEETAQLIQSNVVFGLEVMSVAHNVGCRNFINAASNAEFDERGHSNANTLYAQSKVAFRGFLDFYSRFFDSNIINLVLYDNYGEGDTRRKIFNLLVEHLGKEKRLDLTPGLQTLYPMHISDTVRAFSYCIRNFDGLVETNCNRTFSVVAENGVTVRDIATIVEKISGTKLRLKWGGREYRSNEIMSPWVGEKLPDWRPRVGLEQGLSLLIK